MKHYKKDLLLICEGPDGSGKSSIINALKLLPDFKDIELKDRSTISEKVYAMKFKRELTDGIPVNIHTTYWEYYFKSHYDTRIILCNPSAETLALRCIEKEDPLARNRTYEQLVEHLSIDKSLFETCSEMVSKTYNFRLLNLDTEQTIDECIDKIEEFIEDARI